MSVLLALQVKVQGAPQGALWAWRYVALVGTQASINGSAHVFTLS